MMSVFLQDFMLHGNSDYMILFTIYLNAKNSVWHIADAQLKKKNTEWMN